MAKITEPEIEHLHRWLKANEHRRGFLYLEPRETAFIVEAIGVVRDLADGNDRAGDARRLIKGIDDA